MNKLFEALLTRAVWEKGYRIPGEDPKVWRSDDFGNRINFYAFRNRSSAYGWERDHIIPRALGGSDDLSNFRPLHWRKNASLGGILGKLVR